MEEIADLKDWYDKLWYTSLKFANFEHRWMNSPIKGMDQDEFEQEIHTMWGISYKLSKIFKPPDFMGPLRVTLKLKSKIESLKTNTRLVQILTNPGLKPRHFQSMKDIIGIDITPTETMCLKDMQDEDKALIEKHVDKLVAIVNVASKEFSFENTFKNMKSDWREMKFTFVAYKDLDLKVLASVEEMQCLIEDHLTKSTTIISSSIFAEFRRQVQEWFSELVNILVI